MEEFDPNKFRAIVKAIRQMIKCPSCQATFSEQDVEMVAGVGPSYFVRMTCGVCNVSVMASLMQVGQNEISGEINTEMPTIDAAQSEPVSSDDVIEVHKFLKDFNGDFQGLME